MCQPIELSRWSHQLIGVIDLQGGYAVHGVAGDRDSYKPVGFCQGDAEQLARHYLDQGVCSLYVADLDGLSGETVQLEACERLINLGFRRVWIDLGWRSCDRGVTSEMGRMSRLYPSLGWMLATETEQRVEGLDSLLLEVPAEKICISLDFTAGRFRGRSHDWRDWIVAAVKRSVTQFLVLDVASVGTSRGVPTQSLCRQIKREWPEVTLSSGGGVRGEVDVQGIINAGCESVLVATALFPQATG